MRSLVLPSARPASVPLVLLTGLLAAAPLPVKAAGEISQARETYKEYIAVRKLIGEESTAWQSEQVALADMISVLKAEAAQIEEAMDTLRSSASTADQRRADLNEQLEQARATSTAFNSTIAEFESSLKSLATRLPDPLRRELQPLLARIPDDSSATRLNYSQRLQSIIGVLAQTDKFNTDVKYVSEVKTVDDESFEVQTLYFGLASALFTDATGRYAGHGHPAADGWKWQRVTGPDAVAIAQAMDVYLSRKSPAFVSVPLQVD
jgi:septal ring factor EnvC (AmiA/AmiB activator)